MTIFEKRKAKNTIKKTAKLHGVTAQQCRADMEEAIDEAWKTSRQDPAAKAAWDKYFPDGQKPSVEEFIMVLGTKLKENN